MQTQTELQQQLQRLDHRSYTAYKSIKGAYCFDALQLFIDHVQGDPFAAPSRVRIRVPQSRSQLKPSWYNNNPRRIALTDYLARRLRQSADSERRVQGSGKSGVIRVDAGGQQVLERTAVAVNEEFVEARIEVGLPAAGRRILGRAAADLLCDQLPAIAYCSLCRDQLDESDVEAFLDCIENQEHIRTQLPAMGLIAFVADGSALPRASGVSDLPLQNAVLFESPDSLAVAVPVLNPVMTEHGPKKVLRGMGIRQGVTLIVGGGYHGKSTLLRALQSAVYPHVTGDGREYVVSDRALVKVKAEDGRRIECVDIGGFISDLPGGSGTQQFRSDCASGSTSQAANIIEAWEAGATGLLLDEDTLATNFMVRDSRMQQLVCKDHEPITPYLERVRELSVDFGLSSVLVMGGCGDYFDVADVVIMMREFAASDVTGQARQIAGAHSSGRRSEARGPLTAPPGRIPDAKSVDPSRGRKEVAVDVKAVDSLVFGSEMIDLRGVEQIVDRSQTRAIGAALELARRRLMDGRTVREILEELTLLLDRDGLDILRGRHARPGEHPGNLARPRMIDVAAALNRLRTVKMAQRPP